jgi:CRP/FNR family transcriptional regulator
LVRVAAFLSALASQNASEGRDPGLIADSLTCGLVSSILDLDIQDLERTLVQLQRLRLIRPDGGAIRICSVGLLEELAVGNDRIGVEHLASDSLNLRDAANASVKA